MEVLAPAYDQEPKRRNLGSGARVLVCLLPRPGWTTDVGRTGHDPSDRSGNSNRQSPAIRQRAELVLAVD